MNDEEILREAEGALREALRVEPSLSLLRQVRASAAETGPGPAAAWPLVTAAVLVLASAAALALFRSPRPKTVEPAVAPAAAAMEAPGPVAPRPVVPFSRGTSPLPRLSQTRVPSSAEIIVPGGQAAAMVRLVELARSGVIAPPRGLIDPLDPAASLSEPAAVRIEPLTIAPLEAASSSAAGSPLGRGAF